MRLRILLLVALFIVLFISSGSADGQDEQKLEHPHELFLGTLWVRTSAEYYASAIQAYRTAQFRLDEALRDPEWTADPNQKTPYALPPAVIMDVDETVLDNTGFEIELIKNNASYTPAMWTEWVNRSSATLVPGALEFIRYAQKRGVRVIYVTNRKAHEEAATRVNLAKVGVQLDNKTDEILTRGERPDWSADKTTRRRIVSKQYRVLLYIGDNMNDFLAGVRVKPQERTKLAIQHKQRWGREWIVLPNPIYGTWEQSLYDFDYKLSNRDKLKRKHEYLKAHQ